MNPLIGLGGGGGGGHILMAPSNASYPTDVSGGVAGVQASADRRSSPRRDAETRPAGVLEAP